MNPTLLPIVDLLAKSTSLLLLAWAVQSFWRSASATQRCLVWLTVFTVLLPLPLTLLLKPLWTVAVHDGSAVPPPPPRVVRMEPLPEIDPLLLQQAMEMAPAPVAAPKKSWMEEHFPDQRAALMSAAFYLWSGVALLLIARRLLGTVQLMRLRRRSRVCPCLRIHGAFERLKEELGIRRVVELRESSEVSVPMTWGVLHPVLLLPAESGEWSRENLHAALRHELGHIRHRDALTRFLMTLACALQWPNPLVWMAARAWRLQQEQSCDDLVVSSGASRESYAMQLLNAARSVQRSGGSWAAALTMAVPSTLETRLAAIMDESRRRAPLSRVALLLGSAVACGLLALSGALQLRAASPPEPSPDPQSQPVDEVKPLPAPILIRSKIIQAKDGASLDTFTKRLSSAGLPVLISQEDLQKKLEEVTQLPGVDLLSSPSVVTRSGQNAQVSVSRDVLVQGEEKPLFMGVKLEVNPTRTESGFDIKANALLRDLGEGPAKIPHGDVRVPRSQIRERRVTANMSLRSGDTVLVADPDQLAAGKRPDMIFLITVEDAPQQQVKPLQGNAAAPAEAPAKPVKLTPKVDLTALKTSFDPQTSIAKGEGDVAVTITFAEDPSQVWKAKADSCEWDSNAKILTLRGHPEVDDGHKRQSGEAETRMVLNLSGDQVKMNTYGPSKTYIFQSNSVKAVPAPKPSAAQSGGPSRNLDIQAKNTNFDPETGIAKGEGDVHVSIPSPKDPSVVWKAKGDLCEYDSNAKILTLRGHPEVTDGHERHSSDAAETEMILNFGGPEVKLTIHGESRTEVVFNPPPAASPAPFVEARELPAARAQQPGVNYFTVFGQVLRQGKYEIIPGDELTVSEALLRAGGFTGHAKTAKVHVVRKTSEGNKTINVNVDDVMKRGLKEKDIRVHPNDVIIVDEKLFAFDVADPKTPAAGAPPPAETKATSDTGKVGAENDTISFTGEITIESGSVVGKNQAIEIKPALPTAPAPAADDKSVSDEDFFRRVCLAIAGQEPDPGELRDFLADKRDSKIKREEVLRKVAAIRSETKASGPTNAAGVATESDAQFVRRTYLDLTGQEPSPEVVRAFTEDPRDSKTKRGALIQKLTAAKPGTSSVGDAEFIRRAYLDILGRVPTDTEVREFLDSKNPAKRAELIEKLVNNPSSAMAKQKSRNEEAGDRYLKIYLLSKDAEKLQEVGNLADASHKYEEARQLLNQLIHDQPAWQPDVLRFRLEKIESALKKIAEGNGVPDKRAAKQFNVSGIVQRPGAYDMAPEGIKLSEAIQRAGGPALSGKVLQVLVLKTTKGDSIPQDINLAVKFTHTTDLTDGKIKDEVLIQPGDMIVVREENSPPIPLTGGKAQTSANGAKAGGAKEATGTDEEWVRRRYLDITGKEPTPEQVRAFTEDKRDANTKQREWTEKLDLEETQARIDRLHEDRVQLEAKLKETQAQVEQLKKTTPGDNKVKDEEALRDILQRQLHMHDEQSKAWDAVAAEMKKQGHDYNMPKPRDTTPLTTSKGQVLSWNPDACAVIGEVNHPTRVEIPSGQKLTLADVIKAAGGVKEGVKTVTIEGDAKWTTTVQVEHLAETMVKPGDIITAGNPAKLPVETTFEGANLKLKDGSTLNLTGAITVNPAGNAEATSDVTINGMKVMGTNTLNTLTFSGAPQSKEGGTLVFTAAPASGNVAVIAPQSAAQAKAEKIIISSFKLREATVDEAVEFLRVMGKDRDPDKQGVNIVIKADAATLERARITLDLQNVPLMEALRYVAELSNLKLSAGANALILHTEDAKIEGLIKPAGTNGTVVSFTGFVVPPSAGPSVAGKAEQIIIPSVQFAGATVDEALDFLRAKIKQSGKPGVNIVFKGDSATNKVLLTLDLKSVPLMEALRYVAGLANLDLKVEENSIFLLPKGPQPDGPAAPGVPAAPLPPPAPASPAAPPAPEEAKPAAKSPLQTRAEQITLPEVHLARVTVPQALDSFRAQLKKLGKPGDPPINFLYLPGDGPNAELSLDLKNVPLSEALRYVSELGNMKVSEKGDTFVLDPRSPAPSVKNQKFIETTKGAQIILPAMPAGDGTLGRYIENLNADAKKFDPAHVGVAIVLKADSNAKKTIDWHLIKDVPLPTALRLIEEIFHLEHREEGDALILVPKKGE